MTASLAQQFNDAAALHGRCACFGARIDLLGKLGEDVAIAELKTGKQLQPAFCLQTAGQAMALTKQAQGPGDLPYFTKVRRLLIRLGDDGAFHMTEYKDAIDFDVVFSAAEVSQWRLRHDAKAKKLAPHDHALYREDGTQVPGIGTVLALAGLVDLRDVPPHILEAAALKGSLVHTAIEYLVADDLDEEHLDPTLKGYVESFKRFRDATGFQVKACEKSVVFDCTR